LPRKRVARVLLAIAARLKPFGQLARAARLKGKLLLCFFMLTALASKLKFLAPKMCCKNAKILLHGIYE